MKSFGLILAEVFTENNGIIVITLSIRQDSLVRAVPHLPSDIYKPQMNVKLIK
jgi:hypothetical protein